MPNYTYICNEGHAFDKVVSIAERENLQQCPVEGCGRIAKRDPHPMGSSAGINVPGGTPRFYR